MSGMMNLTSQAAMMISMNVYTLIFCLPLSFSFSLSALIGGSLGAGDVAKAKRVTKYATIMCMSICLILAVGLSLLSNKIVQSYSNS